MARSGKRILTVLTKQFKRRISAAAARACFAAASRMPLIIARVLNGLGLRLDVRDVPSMDSIRHAINFSDGSEHVKAVYAAGVVVLQVLGREWYESNIGDKPEVTSLKVHDSNQFGDQLLRLAEVFYRLKNCAGFYELIGRTRNEFDSAFFEALVASSLVGRGFHVRFEPDWHWGRRSHDFTILHSEGPIYAECKACLTSEFTADYLRNRLRKARAQLPEGGPGIIYVKLPGIKDADRAMLTEKEKIARAFLRNSRRVSAVVLIWDVYSRFDNGLRSRGTGFVPYLNLNPSVRLPADLLTPAHPKVNPRPAFWPPEMPWSVGKAPEPDWPTTAETAKHEFKGDGSEE